MFIWLEQCAFDRHVCWPNRSCSSPLSWRKLVIPSLPAGCFIRFWLPQVRWRHRGCLHCIPNRQVFCHGKDCWILSARGVRPLMRCSQSKCSTDHKGQFHELPIYSVDKTNYRRARKCNALMSNLFGIVYNTEFHEPHMHVYRQCVPACLLSICCAITQFWALLVMATKIKHILLSCSCHYPPIY